MKANKTLRGQAVLKHRRRKGKESESKLTQLHTIQPRNNKNNQMTGITTYTSIPTVNVNGINSINHFANWIKKEDQQSVV
jgi:hypothetical protein